VCSGLAVTFLDLLSGLSCKAEAEEVAIAEYGEVSEESGDGFLGGDMVGIVLVFLDLLDHPIHQKPFAEVDEIIDRVGVAI